MQFTHAYILFKKKKKKKKKLEYIYKTRQNAAFEHEFNKANLKVSTNYRIMEMYSENI